MTAKETPLRRAWLIFALTGLGCCVGALTLLYGAAAYIKLPGLALFRSYFHHPALLGLNLLPPVLLIWLFYFLTRRGWGAFLGSEMRKRLQGCAREKSR